MSTGVEWAVHCCVVLSEAEGPFLTYLACRINGELGRFERGEQCEARTRAHIRLLANRAREILGRDEVDAWLEAASNLAELPRIVRRRREGRNRA